MYIPTRVRRSLEKDGIDVAKVEEKAKEIITSVADDFSIAEVEFLIKSLTMALERLKCRKPGEPFVWDADY